VRSKIMVLSMLVVGMALIFFCPQGDQTMSVHPFLSASSSQLFGILSLFLLAIWGGWEIRQLVYNNYHEERINELMREDDTSLLALQKKEHALHALLEQSLAVKKSLDLKQDQLARVKRDSSRLEIEIEHIGDSNLALSDKIQSVDREIGYALEQLGMIKEVRMEFLKNIERVNHYEHEVKILLDEMAGHERRLPILKRRNRMLQKEITLFEKTLAEQEEHLISLQLETELSKEHYRVKKFAVIREIEAQEEQEQSYKKALSLIEYGIKNGKKVSFMEVDRLLKQVDSTLLGWMDHWGNKITQLLKGKGDPKRV